MQLNRLIKVSGRIVATSGLLFPALPLLSQSDTQPNTAQAAQPNRGPGMFDLAPPLFDLDSSYLQWPLSESAKEYAPIQGAPIKRMTEDLTAIARQSKLDGNQFWGRIAGTKYDALTQQYVLKKFQEFGLQNSRIQPIPLRPQWMAKSWQIALVQGGQRTPLAATFPLGGSPNTPTAGLDLPLVWVGLGTAADFIGRDVGGKAVVIYATPEPSVFLNSATLNESLKRAQDRGAAAVLVSLEIPGNVTSQMNARGRLSVPAFSIGMQDGTKLRQAIETAGEATPRIHVELDAGLVSGMTSGNVWGELPGTTDENILVIAHLDSFFEGAIDNASGVATMLALAEYYSKLPKEQRRRRITFVGTAAHHTTGVGGISAGTVWMHQNLSDFFAKTALILNCEHPAEVETYLWGNPPVLRKSTSLSGVRMFAITGGSSLKEIAVQAFRTFGIGVLSQPEMVAAGDMGPIYRDAPSIQVINIPLGYHTDIDTPDLVPAPGLEAATRAFAYVIDRVNRVKLEDLR